MCQVSVEITTNTLKGGGELNSVYIKDEPFVIFNVDIDRNVCVWQVVHSIEHMF